VGWNNAFAALVTMSLLVTGAGAEPRSVVVELYTSQGCSSCPPADRLLRELSSHDHVTPLAFHVDYWDYLGWKDSFASPAHTERQRAYARAAGQRTIYTPQMIVAGEDRLVGTKPMKLLKLIEKHRGRRSDLDMSASRDGDVVRIEARAMSGFRKPVVIQLVRYVPEGVVPIHRGENTGRTITYSNIVTELVRLGVWDGSKPLVIETVISGDDPVVVILQQAGHGPILASANLR